MKNLHDTALEDLRHLATLRAIAPTLPSASRRAVDAVASDLATRVGPVVPKRRAAALLGISVQALDEWIRRGRITAIGRAGGTRTGIDADSLIWTANQIPTGAARPGRAVDDARRRAAFWRFNEAVTAADGRTAAAMPLEERIRHIDALNASMHLVEAMGRRSAAMGAERYGARGPNGR